MRTSVMLIAASMILASTTAFAQQETSSAGVTRISDYGKKPPHKRQKVVWVGYSSVDSAHSHLAVHPGELSQPQTFPQGVITASNCRDKNCLEPEVDSNDGSYARGKVPMAQQWGAYPLEKSCCNGLRPWVTYKDIDEMHPAAKPLTIWVLDPHYAQCNCFEGKMVPIQICVPPCSRPEIKVKLDGRRVSYRYGRYSIDIRIRNNHVEVDYQEKASLQQILPF